MDRDGLPGSCDPSRIVTDCLDRDTGSHVAKRDSGSETSGSVQLPLKKLADRDDPRTSRQVKVDRHDPRRLVTYRHSREAIMRANESDTKRRKRRPQR